MFRTLWFTFALVLSISRVSIAGQLSTVDQFQNSYFGIIAVERSPIGQSFTPVLNRIDAAEFWIDSGNLGITLQLDVLNGENLIGPSLGSSLPLSIPPSVQGITHFDLISPVSLVPGNLYTIRLTRISGGGLAVGVGINNPYTHGNALEENNSSSVVDLVFAEGLHEVFIPEPSTAILAALGLACLVPRRR